MFDRFGTRFVNQDSSFHSKFFSSLRTKINFIKEVRHAYKKFNSIAYNTIRNNFPISVTFNDGIQMKVTNVHDLVFLARYDSWKSCKIIGDELLVSFNGTTVKFVDWRHNGDIQRIFLKEDYNEFPIKNSLVVDIGANIGDSSIYFSLCGAAKVIALEPVLSNYNAMKKNIEINEIKNIEIKNAGCGAEKRKITINSDKRSNGEMILSENGSEVEIITLTDIVNEYNIEAGLLKLDCEGYEQEIIMSTGSKILSKFKYISGELHYHTIKPINEMKEKLEKAGFTVDFKYDFYPEIPSFIEAKIK
jgi:FkbM family methyltransferase|tara:strand:+ start:139 stop:1050 length:912 start_codon:yes stop_codon:yes gene_type:complete